MKAHNVGGHEVHMQGRKWRGGNILPIFGRKEGAVLLLVLVLLLNPPPNFKKLLTPLTYYQKNLRWLVCNKKIVKWGRKSGLKKDDAIYGSP